MKTILIHGLGQNASAWEKTVSALPDTRFLLPEMSEFTGDGSWQELYRNFSAWLGMQGTQLCLCGLSLGAVLALNYAAEYPERVRSMLLIAPQFRMPKAMLRFQALLFRVMPEKSFAGAGLSKKQFITLTSDMAALDFTPALNRISCPVITACGDKDKANFALSPALDTKQTQTRRNTLQNSYHKFRQGGNPMDLQSMIDESRRIVFFGGAGVSTESGIPDFRSADGLYNQKYRFPPEQIISHSFFLRDPEEFYRFYRDRMIYPQAKPNAAHLKLSELERVGRISAVITQNIDGLHSAAGSRNVIELHGSIHRNHCMKCGKSFPLEFIMNTDGVPHCECGGIVKPDVVLYEEPLDEDCINRAINAISEADMLIIGGTSLAVQPAAGLIRFFNGRRLAVINKTPTSADDEADIVINASIGEALSGITVNDLT